MMDCRENSQVEVKSLKDSDLTTDIIVMNRLNEITNKIIDILDENNISYYSLERIMEKIKKIKTKEEQRENEVITFNVICTMKRRWAKQFLSMLKYCQDCGQIGRSRRVAIFADGDGDFRPNFEFDESFPCDESPVKDDDGNRLYDAG